MTNVTDKVRAALIAAKTVKHHDGPTQREADALIDCALRELDGMVLVPVEPTEEMCIDFSEAWFSKVRCIDDPEMEDCYRAMIAPYVKGE